MLETNKTSWDRSYLKIAYEFAAHSTCCRKKVGAIIVKDGRIVSSGYNGTAHGLEHCEDYFENIRISNNISWVQYNSDLHKLGSKINIMHSEFSKKYELHAEQNAIAYAAKTNITLEDDDTTLYTTLSPCSDCAKLIVAAGIKKVVYHEEYDRDISGIELLKNMGISVNKIDLEKEIIAIDKEQIKK